MSKYKTTTDAVSSKTYNFTVGANTSVSYTDQYGNNIYFPYDFPMTPPDSGGWSHGEITFLEPQEFPHFPRNDLELAEIKKELNKLKKKLQRKEIPMKNFYNVIVVSIDEAVLLDVKVVAADENEAQYLAGVYKSLEEAKLKPKDVTIIVRSLGQVKIRPEKKRVIVEKE